MKTLFGLTLLTCGQLLANMQPSITDQINRVSEQNAYGKWQGKSQSASALKGFTIDAALLYWQAKMDGLDYATKASAVADLTDPTNVIINAENNVKNLHFNWKPGVQVNLGYIFPQRQQWELSLGWTYLYSTAHGAAITDDPTLTTGFVKPTLWPFLTGGAGDSASAHWSMHFSMIDFLLGRNFFIGQWMAVKPFIGVRGGWIEQHYLAKYHAGHLTNTGIPLSDNSFKLSSHFGGAGLRAGCDLQWLMTPHWSILGNLSGSLLYGRFKAKENVKGTILPSGVVVATNETVVIRDSVTRVKPEIDGRLGLQWQTFFNKGKFRVSAGAFYNLGYWVGQNQLSNNISILTAMNDSQINLVRSDSALELQGGSLELRFEL